MGLENMNGFACSHCDDKITPFGHGGGGEKTVKQAEIESLGKITFDLKMVTCGDSGAFPHLFNNRN